MNGALKATVEALRTQPLSLALVVMNLALLLFLFWFARGASSERVDLYRDVSDMQREVQQLLSHCVVPPEEK